MASRVTPTRGLGTGKSACWPRRASPRCAKRGSTRGLNLVELPKGTRLKIGREALLEVTQIGKVCHQRCAIYYQAGDCVMPREGVFGEVLAGGTVRPGDSISLVLEVSKS